MEERKKYLLEELKRWDALESQMRLNEEISCRVVIKQEYKNVVLLEEIK